jgi:hypothetical protein
MVPKGVSNIKYRHISLISLSDERKSDKIYCSFLETSVVEK